MSQIPTESRATTRALHAYPKKHGLDIEWIANELWNRFKIKVGHSTLGRYLNPDDDLKFPADLIMPFCRICNDDFSVVSFIQKYSVKGEINCSSVARLTKEAGEAVVELAGSIEGGKISHDERQRCIKELMDVKELVNQLLATLIG